MDRETSLVSKRYARRVRAYPDARIFLFGSRARKEHWVTSDFDFLVISKGFAGKAPQDRIGPLLRLWTFHRGMDVVCLTPEEFERQKRRSTFLRIALQDRVAVT